MPLTFLEVRRTSRNVSWTFPSSEDRVFISAASFMAPSCAIKGGGMAELSWVAQKSLNMSITFVASRHCLQIWASSIPSGVNLYCPWVLSIIDIFSNSFKICKIVVSLLLHAALSLERSFSPSNRLSKILSLSSDLSGER